ncbi:GntR family transcriptional regulator [Nocardia terpenica]|uniref:GntR family transcriptional regulator n=1 Tax=Nocardia terpenica TaxID=455432 RepID=UPI002FE2B816
MTSINERSGVLPYLQVAATLREEIAVGKYRTGDQFPSTREIAQRFNVAVNTSTKVIDQLRSEGLLETRRGRGTFVKTRPELFRRGSDRYKRHPAGAGEAPNLAEARAGGWHDEVSAKRWRAPASETIAARLQIEPGSEVTVARYLWTVDDQPIQVGTQYEPLSITRGTAIEEPVDGTRGAPGVIKRFDSIGIHVTRVEEETRVRMPSAEESQILKLGSGIPIFSITRTHWAGETAVETADIAIRGDRMAITTTHDVPLIEGAVQ